MLTRNGLDGGIPVKNPEEIAAYMAAKKIRSPLTSPLPVSEKLRTQMSDQRGF
jgi:hypothetical protein